MPDEPDKNSNEQEPEYDARDAEMPFVTHHVPGHSDETSADEKTAPANHYIETAYQWVASGLALIWSYVPKSASFWTAFATVIMAITTTAYTVLSLCQLNVMDKQQQIMQQQLDITAAQLVVEDFKANRVPTQQDPKVEFTLTIRNAGNTVAHNLSISEGAGVSRVTDSNKLINTTIIPQPDPNGPSLAPGTTKPYRFNGSFLPYMLNGEWNVLTSVEVHYRDIFGKPHVTTDCIMYDGDRGQLTTCPIWHQH